MKELRKKMGLTQAQCAELLGVTRGTVNGWEATEAPTMAIIALKSIAKIKEQKALAGSLRDMAEKLESDK